MTGQVAFDSDGEEGVALALDLANELAIRQAYGRELPASDPLTLVGRIVQADASWPPLRPQHGPMLVKLARQLAEVLDFLAHQEVDAAAGLLNALLAAHPAYPHLASEQGRWRLHHHPVDADLVPMATAICAEGLARLVGAGDAQRFGVCRSDRCDRFFFDESKNQSRRFCSTRCQNRFKAAAFRQRTQT